MAATTKTCPKCGGPLTPAPGDAAKLACKPCGLRFGVRPKKGAAAPTPAGPWPPRNEFADLTDTADAPSKAASASPKRQHTPPAGDPQLRMALLVGAGLVVVFLGLLGAVGIAVVVWARSGPSTPVAVVPVSAPAAPVVSDPAPDPTPPPAPKEIAAPVTPPNKPFPPAPPIPPRADPVPMANPAPPDPAPGDAVGRAVAKAVAYLKKRVEADLDGDVFAKSNRTGVMALIGLALLESGVAPDDPAVQKAMAEVRDKALSLQNTYELSLCVWFLDRLGDAKDEELIRSLAIRLIAAQDRNGLWHYASPPIAPAQQKGVLEALNKYDVGTAIPAAADLPAVCLFHRGQSLEDMKAPPDLGDCDLSLTQFAVLALWASRKHNIPVDRSLLLTEAYCRAKQAADGSWSYGRGPSGYMSDSMTCAGLMALAVARGVDRAPNAKAAPADPAVEKSLAFLGDVFDRGIPLGGPGAALRAAATKAMFKLYFSMVNNPATIDVTSAEGRALFKAGVEKILESDPPNDVKKEMHQVLDRLKQYGDSPAPENKNAFLQAAWGCAMGHSVVGYSRAFFIPRPPVSPEMWDDIYFLWSMERMAVVYDFKTIAGHDWYAWGADLLVSYQNDDGSWSTQFRGPVDTGLALLFLKRANVAKDLTAKLQLIGIKDVSGDRTKAPPK